MVSCMNERGAWWALRLGFLSRGGWMGSQVEKNKRIFLEGQNERRGARTAL